jgi:hypothetical protein
MSELEQEFELEMDEQSYSSNEQFSESEMEYEFEYDEDSPENEYEYGEDAPESEYEYEDDSGEGFDVPPWAKGQRFYELAQYEFESEYELDRALSGVLDDMEREYFLKNVAKGLKKFGKILDNPLVNIAAGAIPGVSAALNIAKEVSKINKHVPKRLKKRLGGLAKAGIKSLAPGAPRLASSFPKRLGLYPGATEQAARNAFQKIEDGIKRSFEYAAHYFGDHVADPEEADRLVNRAFEAGMAVMTQPQGASQPEKSFHSRSKEGVRTISLQERPGEEIRKIVIVIDKRR